MGTISVANNSFDSTGDGTTHSSVLTAPGFMDRGMLVVRILSESGPGISDSLVVLVVVVHKWGAWVLHNTELFNNLGGSLGDNVSARVAMSAATMTVTVTLFVIAMA